MSIQDFFDSCEDCVEIPTGFQLNWSAKGIGFGEFYFRQNEDGEILISNEAMSKEFIKRILCNMVDNAKLV